MNWKKNRKSRLGLGLQAEAGAAYAPRFDESGEPIKSAGEATEALLAIGLRSSTGAAYRSRRDASGKSQLGGGADEEDTPHDGRWQGCAASSTASRRPHMPP